MTSGTFSPTFEKALGMAYVPAGLAEIGMPLEIDVLAKNDGLATINREWLARREIVALNLMSSPGSGKTTLLERTVRELDLPVSVLEGDQETVLDADRIAAAGARVVQINTGAGCHLDADMVARALPALAPADDVAQRPSFVCAERHFGTFERVVQLESPVDTSRIEARLDGGLLVVTLPKIQDRRGKKLRVAID